MENCNTYLACICLRDEDTIRLPRANCITYVEMEARRQTVPISANKVREEAEEKIEEEKAQLSV